VESEYLTVSISGNVFTQLGSVTRPDMTPWLGNPGVSRCYFGDDKIGERIPKIQGFRAGSLTHNQKDYSHGQLCRLIKITNGTLQEINASNNTDGKIQPLATQAKVPRPAKHGVLHAASRLLKE
jgi:hypothetical protein